MNKHLDGKLGISLGRSGLEIIVCESLIVETKRMNEITWEDGVAREKSKIES